MANKRKITKEIIEAKTRLETWQAVSDALFDGKINGTVLSRIANPDDDYFPQEKAILDILCPPKEKPDYRLRPLQCLCTEDEYNRLLRRGTRARTLIALGEQNG